MASSKVVVQENGRGRYQQDVLAGQHHLLAGEPASMGGDDAGPAPFDFILAALGSCTSITLRMYAERKGLELTQISVELAHNKAESEGRTVDRITRVIPLEGNLTEAERSRLLEIAQKCPVHRTLSPSFQLDCRLKS